MDQRTELGNRLLAYAARVISLIRTLPHDLVSRRIADQLLRCSMAVGANYEEAQAGESREDFVHKLQIALKELRESNYWLRLLGETATLTRGRLDALTNESEQLKAILSKAVATTKGSHKQPVKGSTQAA